MYACIFSTNLIYDFCFIVTGAYSDCLLLLVCLFTVVIQQVLARPASSQDYHLNMSLEPNVQSLEDALRSPCREANLPREDQSPTSIKGVLQIIGRQSAIAKSIAKEDIEKYVSTPNSIELKFVCLDNSERISVRQYGDSIQKWKKNQTTHTHTRTYSRTHVFMYAQMFIFKCNKCVSK